MRVKSIRSVEPRTVYAIETSTGTFIADGLAHHNCVGCNQFLNGNEAMYSSYIIDTYGVDEFNRLIDTARSWRAGKLKPLTIVEMEDLVEVYEARIAALEVQPPKK